MESDAMILVFWMLSFKPAFLLYYFTFIKRLFSSSLLFAIRVVSFIYLRLLIFLLAILIASDSYSLTVFMMHSAYNKQGDNIQPRHGNFPILNQSIVPCLVLTCFLICIQVSQEIGKVNWYTHPLRIVTVCYDPYKVFSTVNEVEVDVFLDFPCFLSLRHIVYT